jgi:hypothetical protein
MKQADLIVGALVADAVAAGCPFNAVFCYRAQQVIAQAIDEALAQGGPASGQVLSRHSDGYRDKWHDGDPQLADEREALERATGAPVAPLEAATAATKAEKAPRKRKGGRKAKRRGNAAKAEPAAAAPSEGA